MTWWQTLLALVAASVGSWAATYGLGRCYLAVKARRLARLHLAVSARLHESQRQLERQQQRADILLIRLGRQQERGEGLREISEAAALAAQLFGPLTSAE